MDSYICRLLRNQCFSGNYWPFKIYAFTTSSSYNTTRNKRLSLATVVNRLCVIMGRVSFITISTSKILIGIVSSMFLLSGYFCSSFTQDLGQHSRLDISRSFSSTLGFSEIYFSRSFTTIFFPDMETSLSQQQLNHTKH